MLLHNEFMWGREFYLNTYMLTAYNDKGENLLNEAFEATSDVEAKIYGEQLLQEKELLETTHRCTSPLGKLLLFHS